MTLSLRTLIKARSGVITGLGKLLAQGLMLKSGFAFINLLELRGLSKSSLRMRSTLTKRRF